MLYLKSPDSKATRARTAAISWGEVMVYLPIAAMRKGAAWTFVAHSEGNGAPEQVLDVGAILRIWSAAELACRGEREEVVKVGLGSAAA